MSLTIRLHGRTGRERCFSGMQGLTRMQTFCSDLLHSAMLCPCRSFHKPPRVPDRRVPRRLRVGHSRPISRPTDLLQVGKPISPLQMLRVCCSEQGEQAGQWLASRGSARLFQMSCLLASCWRLPASTFQSKQGQSSTAPTGLLPGQ